jgi:arsenate reductase-like glutaredoxin family protein
MADEVSKLIVAKGKKVVNFSMNKERPNNTTLLAHMLGPTGNLRAPTIRRGRTLIVGFNEEAYTTLFGP